MASLTNPIRAQNIIDRFADYVAYEGNVSIVWGTNNYPFAEFIYGAEFGGDTGGKAIEISGAGTSGVQIRAADIRVLLQTETVRYTRIRNLRAILNVTGGGGNNGSRPTAGYIYDATAKAHLNAKYMTQIAEPTVGPTANTVISAAGLEAYFAALRAEYWAKRDIVVTFQTDVCHASCHSSCHDSRGRR